MARARNIKPGIMANEFLADLPPIDRLLFIYLWMLADREGRLEDRPRQIKALALPYDDLDVDESLSRIARAGFIVRYVNEGRSFIQITNFSKHQTPHPREQASVIPECESGQEVIEIKEENKRNGEAEKRQCLGHAKQGTSPSDVLIPDTLIPDVLIPDTNTSCAGVLPLTPTENLPVPIKPRSPAKPKEPAPTSQIWESYRQAYAQRYEVDPVRNAKVNGQLAQLLQRLGADDAVAVAAWFVWHNDRWYVSKMHSVDCLLRDCEKLRTEWATGRTMTQHQARQTDRMQGIGSTVENLRDKLRREGKLA